MADEQSMPPIEMQETEKGVFSCYSNNINLSWTAFDVKMHFGEFYDDIREMPIKSNIKITKQAVITLTWSQAKQIADLMAHVIARYEETNGKIPNVEDFKNF